MRKHLHLVMAFALSFAIALPAVVLLQSLTVFAFTSQANIAATTDFIKDCDNGTQGKWKSVDFGSTRRFTRVSITIGSATDTTQFQMDKYNFTTKDWDNLYPAGLVPGTGATRTFDVNLSAPADASKIRVFLPAGSTGAAVSSVAVYNDSPIVTASTVDITTSVGVPPVLPNFYNIAQDNGGRVLLAMTWPALASQSREKCATVGTYQVSGTYVSGTESGTITANITVNADSGVAPMPTPYMGWNDWYYAYSGISERIAKDQATSMIQLGLDKLGYNLIWIDDYWWGKGVNSYAANEEYQYRDANGHILTRENFNFDYGQWVDWLHSKGLKSGIYSDTGPHGCGEYFGSGGNNWFEFYRKDVEQFVNWKVDAVKLDHCGGHNGLTYNEDVYSAFYQAMQDKDPNHKIMFDTCEWGQESPPEWAYKIANAWRTQGDLGGQLGSWSSFLNFFDDNLAPAANGPNHVSDPDYIIFGEDINGNKESQLTDFQTRSYFTLWCMTASPLILSSDMASINDYNLQTITNADMISIDQDSLCKQYTIVREDLPGLQVCAKPLKCDDPGKAKYAVMLFNRTGYDGTIGFNWSDIGLSNVVSAKNVWDNTTETITGPQYSADVKAYGTTVYIVEGDVVARTCARPVNNLALGFDVEALGNSGTNPKTNAQKAVDGYSTTNWQPLYRDYNNAYWIQVDMGVEKTFDQVVLRMSTSPGVASTIDTSDDGKTWTTQQNIGTLSTTADNTVNLPAPVTARFVRWYIPNATTTRPVLSAFSVFDSAHPDNPGYQNLATSSGQSVIDNLALKATASASSQYNASYSAAMINDGNTGTRWNSAANVMTNGTFTWVELTYPQATAANCIMLDAAASSWYLRLGKARIEYSDDNTNWTQFAVIALNPGPGEIQVTPTTVIPYPNISHKYYRIVFMQGLSQGGGTDPTIWEWRMYNYPITAVKDTFVMTDAANTAGALPQTVPATRSDGLTFDTPVIWDAYPLTVGTHTVHGTIAGSDVKANAVVLIIDSIPSQYVLNFNVTPFDAAVALTDGTGATVAPLVNGVYQLSSGTYSYAVSKANYISQSGTVVIDGSAVTVPITLDIVKYSVGFNLSVPDAKVVVTDANAAVVSSVSPGSYKLAMGTYTYSVTRLGYFPISGTFDVTGDMTVPVYMVMKDNLALFAAATASSIYNTGYTAVMANDDDLNTRWNTALNAATQSSENWLQLEWDKPTASNTAVIYFSWYQRIGRAALQYWDGSKWVDLAVMSDNDMPTDPDEIYVLPVTRITYPTVTTTKLRINFYEARNYSGTDYTVREFRIYNYPVVSADPATAETFVNTAPVMPATVNATRSNGLSCDKTPVVWDAINPSDYAQQGTFTVGGTVAGTDVRTKVTVTVKDLEPGAEAIAFFDDAGNDITPINKLPDTGNLKVRAVINNGGTGSSTVRLITAVYSGSRLISTDAKTMIIAAQIDATADLSLNLPADRTGLTVKVFQWGENYDPLCLPINFPS